MTTDGTLVCSYYRRDNATITSKRSRGFFWSKEGVSEPFPRHRKLVKFLVWKVDGNSMFGFVVWISAVTTSSMQKRCEGEAFVSARWEDQAHIFASPDGSMGRFPGRRDRTLSVEGKPRTSDPKFAQAAQAEKDAMSLDVTLLHHVDLDGINLHKQGDLPRAKGVLGSLLRPKEQVIHREPRERQPRHHAWEFIQRNLDKVPFSSSFHKIAFLVWRKDVHPVDGYPVIRGYIVWKEHRSERTTRKEAIEAIETNPGHPWALDVVFYAFMRTHNAKYIGTIPSMKPRPGDRLSRWDVRNDGDVIVPRPLPRPWVNVDAYVAMGECGRKSGDRWKKELEAYRRSYRYRLLTSSFP